MSIKVSTPEDLKQISIDNVEEQIEAFEEQLKKEANKEYHNLVIYMQTSEEGCEIIANLYKDAGWKNVECNSYILDGNDSFQTDLKFDINSNNF